MKTFKENLQEVFHPMDKDDFIHVYPRYEKLLEITNLVKPEKVIEIGVRAGYSSFTFFQSESVKNVLGIDSDFDERFENTHLGIRGLYKHAVFINEKYDYSLMIVDSHRIHKLPKADLIYIDGDHTTPGCYLDLCLAAQSTKKILCDDYCVPFRNGVYEVREAVDMFVRNNKARGTYFDNLSTGLYLIELD